MLKGFIVFGEFGGADVAAGGEDIALGLDLREGGGFAETGDVCVIFDL